MKKYINKFFLLGSIIIFGASCENDAILTSLKAVDFSTEIEASAKTLVLTEINANQNMELISWPAVVFPIKAPVTYTIQFDLIGNTSGGTAWINSKRIEVGEDALSKSFLGKDLNKIAIDLGLKPNVVGILAVRVEATLDRKIYSNSITLTITPYEKSVVFGAIYMPGSYQGWGIDTAAELSAIESGVYLGYVTIPTGSGLGFKLNTARNWDQFYGADKDGNLKSMSDTDLVMPGVGTYQIKANLNTFKWNAVPYSWGVVGDATSGSWDNSTPMTFDHVLKLWKITIVLKSGNVKFRLNNNWTINYGPKNAGSGIVNLDDPAAHYIGEAGTYDITLKINDIDTSNGYPKTATYTVTKK
ncbi:SusE domain-containing protein [Flavobacterium cellulosilyticum]|uniref:SusE outer membrane protein domain-containing protein n=1 Tax=Flavobacterium cellulosilyticum TaxID=2541731 RepID=A0A4R5C1T9_9FLAO|nr:SusE domain-containing protein [Flavobacterium cellulosilyticum]TDD93551.1 hypothetical protein E0F76_18935 [Flavobacterium cellulosilyticum]